MKHASIGSISTGTLRTEDLLDAFAFELEDLVQKNAEIWCSDSGRKHRDRLLKLVWDAREIEDYDSDEALELVEELHDALNDFAPDFCSFGAHPGDGADFGFWPMEMEDIKQQVIDDDGLVVDDTSKVPDNFSGYVMHINDHGNVTLYCATEGKLDELWSCV